MALSSRPNTESSTISWTCGSGWTRTSPPRLGVEPVTTRSRLCEESGCAASLSTMVRLYHSKTGLIRAGSRTLMSPRVFVDPAGLEPSRDTPSACNYRLTKRKRYSPSLRRFDPRSRIPLLSCLFRGFRIGHASSAESVLQPIIRLVAGVFVELARHLRHGQLARPWFGPHPRVFHGEFVEDRFRVHAGEAFDHVQVLGSRERTQI